MRQIDDWRKRKDERHNGNNYDLNNSSFYFPPHKLRTKRQAEQWEMGQYHFKEENRTREVGILFEVRDDGGLYNLPSTFHNQTGWWHTS